MTILRLSSENRCIRQDWFLPTGKGCFARAAYFTARLKTGNRPAPRRCASIV